MWRLVALVLQWSTSRDESITQKSGKAKWYHHVAALCAAKLRTLKFKNDHLSNTGLGALPD